MEIKKANGKKYYQSNKKNYKKDWMTNIELFVKMRN